MVSLFDKVSGMTVLCFQDSGDDDYKDVLFYIEPDVTDAIYGPDKDTTGPEEKVP